MDESAIKPLNNNVLIRLNETAKTFAGGKLIMPDVVGTEERFQCPRGKVVAVGPGARATKTGVRIPIDLKPGDAVLLRKHYPEAVNMFDDTLIMVDAAMVEAVEVGV